MFRILIVTAMCLLVSVNGFRLPRSMEETENLNQDYHLMVDPVEKANHEFAEASQEEYEDVQLRNEDITYDEESLQMLPNENFALEVAEPSVNKNVESSMETINKMDIAVAEKSPLEKEDSLYYFGPLVEKTDEAEGRLALLNFDLADIPTPDEVFQQVNTSLKAKLVILREGIQGLINKLQAIQDSVKPTTETPTETTTEAPTTMVPSGP